MKLYKILSHPFVLIMSFFMILISGQHFGGFYLLYIMLALPNGGLHAISALLGTILLVVAYYKFRRLKRYRIENILNLIALSFLLISIIYFFKNDKTGYNEQTFSQPVPLFSLLIFGVIVIFFLIDNLADNTVVRRSKKSE